MEIKLVRRWGSRPAGETVEVDDAQGHWLIDTAFGVRPGDEERSRHGGPGRTYPGGGGPDNLAGGDPTRLRPTDSPKGPRDGERARRVNGAPRACGDVTHVKPENLGPEHKGDGGDVLLASGKSLREDLAEHQAELDEQDKKRSSKKVGEGEKSAPKGAPPASDESPASDSKDEGRKLTQKPKS
jgi:hypothetical protein